MTTTTIDKELAELIRERGCPLRAGDGGGTSLELTRCPLEGTLRVAIFKDQPTMCILYVEKPDPEGYNRRPQRMVIKSNVDMRCVAKILSAFTPDIKEQSE